MSTIPRDHVAAAEALRAEAKRLRQLADRLLNLDALRLDRSAGPATWSGPRPALCERLLQSSRTQIERSARELRETARQLDRQADDEEQRARQALVQS